MQQFPSHDQGATGGEYNHELSWDEMPEHNHVIMNGDNVLSGGNFGTAATRDPVTDIWDGIKMAQSRAPGSGFDEKYVLAGSATAVDRGPTSVEGDNQPHNNLQPYVVVYAWRRTA